jgi:hypothetical protein
MGVLAQRTAAMTQALEYDCTVFDTNNMCVSFIGRYGSTGDNFSEAAGVLTLAYRPIPELRIGGFIEQSLPMDSGQGVSNRNVDPLYGAFLVYEQNYDNSGLRVRLSAARQDGSIRITRDASLSNTEPGNGKAGVNSFGYAAEASYGFPGFGDAIIAPYVGIRQTTARRNRYQEGIQDDVEYPISYNKFLRELVTATSGVRGFMQYEGGWRTMARVGVEHDISTRQDAYSGSSSITDLETFSISMDGKARRTRGVGSLGVGYNLEANTLLTASATVRQQSYTSDLSSSVLVQVAVGF